MTSGKKTLRSSVVALRVAQGISEALDTFVATAAGHMRSDSLEDVLLGITRRTTRRIVDDVAADATPEEVYEDAARAQRRSKPARAGEAAAGPRQMELDLTGPKDPSDVN